MSRSVRLSKLLLGAPLVASIGLASCGSSGEKAAPTTGTTPTTATQSTATSVLETTSTTRLELTTTTSPPSGSKDCGLINFAKVENRVVAVRDVSCEEARRITALYDQLNRDAMGDWTCYLGREGDSENVVCGAGEADEIRDSPRLFYLRPPSAPIG